MGREARRLGAQGAHQRSTDDGFEDFLSAEDLGRREREEKNEGKKNGEKWKTTLFFLCRSISLFSFSFYKPLKMFLCARGEKQATRYLIKQKAKKKLSKKEAAAVRGKKKTFLTTLSSDVDLSRLPASSPPDALREPDPRLPSATATGIEHSVIGRHKDISQDPERTGRRRHVQRHETRNALLLLGASDPAAAADLQHVLLGGQHKVPPFDRDRDVWERRKRVAVDDGLRGGAQSGNGGNGVAGGVQLADDFWFFEKRVRR